MILNFYPKPNSKVKAVKWTIIREVKLHSWGILTVLKVVQGFLKGGKGFFLLVLY